jgi:hypothetical protein
MFEQCEFTSAVNAYDEKKSLAQCLVDRSYCRLDSWRSRTYLKIDHSGRSLNPFNTLIRENKQLAPWC